jgi:spoIIIJ-associated protein
VASDLDTRMKTFLDDIGAALGLDLEVAVEPIEDGTRITVAGPDCEIFLQRRAAGLDALQHIVNAVFRREHPGRHIAVDCLDYRKNTDSELRETAKLLAERARTTGVPQEIGPLNPYARRIVHLAVAEDPGVTSESIGDAFMKAVVITASG